MISNVVLHSLPAGYRFDLRRRHRVAAPGAARDPRRRGGVQLTTGRASGSRRRAAVPWLRAPRPDRPRPRGARRMRRDAPRPEPTLRILETRILRGPNYWAREPVIRMLVDLGVLEEFPSNTIPGFVDAPRRAPAVARGPRLLARPAGRLPDPAARGHLGGPRRRARRARAPEPRRHRRPPRQDPLGRAARPVQRHLRVPRGAGRPRGRPASPSPSSTTSSRPDDPAVRVRLRARSSSAHPARRAVGLRPVDPGPHRRGGEPRHPVHPARPVHARPARPGRPPAADPGHDDVADERRSGSTSRRTRASPTGCSTRPACPCRDPRSSTPRKPPSAAARRLGFPCVVKPLDGNHGRGVHLDLRSEEAVRAAFHGALGQSRGGDVVVETYVTGNDYRCLVIGGKRRGDRRAGPGLGDRRRRAHDPPAGRPSRTRTRAAASATRRS